MIWSEFKSTLRPHFSWLRCIIFFILPMHFAGCPQGIDPPQVTELIAVAEGSYPMGAGTRFLACKTPDACDDKNYGSFEAWIENHSFAPSLTADLKAFSIDQHEVTNLQYQTCVQDEACSPPAYNEIRLEDDEETYLEYFGNPKYYDYPVVWVTQEQAASYCKYVGKRLPTEAEWEAAGRGKEGRVYPWSKNEEDQRGCKLVPHLTTDSGCPNMPKPESTWDDDTTGDGPDALHHLASNVAEWVDGSWDAYLYCDEEEGYTCKGKPATSCDACQKAGERCVRTCDDLAICTQTLKYLAPSQSIGGITRGGSYRRPFCDLRLFVRRKSTVAAGDVGFRCAK